MSGNEVLVAEEILSALAEGKPVVALETAVLTHGLPRPVNRQVFDAMRRAVLEHGAVPAPVALVEGAVRVGFPDDEFLCSRPGIAKVGLADLPVLAARGASGGTTVATTLWAASVAGIRVFATGGIGGVHRGAEGTFDLSGDLGCLARFRGCLICSGAKAVLDLPKTFEVLEALGVPVVAYGSDELPAFTCRTSGLKAQHRVDSVPGIARVVRARDALGLPQTVVVTNPPPSPAALPADVLERALAPALRQAAALGISGKNLTPFLLAEIASATAGASIVANRALLVDNAGLAARVASELARGCS